MDSILLIGEDLTVLEGRAAALAITGASVTCCTSSELENDFGSGMFDLVILCHTIQPGFKRSSLTAEIFRRWPQAPILQVVRGRGQLSAESGLEANMAFGELGSLAQLTVKLLGKPPAEEWRPLSSWIATKQAA